MAPFGGAQRQDEGRHLLAAPLGSHSAGIRIPALRRAYWSGVPVLVVASTVIATESVQIVPEVFVAKNRMPAAVGTAVAQ